ncbi:MAG: hypothetical protein ACTSPI_01235 [Candidatus Heimdallarchaeaceae archaeon]
MTKVIVNSVTIKDTDGSPDPNKLISWEYEKDDESISEAELILPKTVNDLVNLNNGQLVEIWAGWTTSTDRRYFYGYIDNIKPEGAILKVTCKNEMIMLVRKNVNKVYDSGIDASAGQVSEIVKDLVQTYGGMTATVQASGTEDGKRIDQFKCINTDIFERIMVLKNALDWELYYNDSDRKVYFEPLGYNDSGKTLTVGTEIVAMPEWDFDTNNMINDLRIDGATTQTNITESGQIDNDANWETTHILLSNTPDIVELYMDAATPPTTQKTGGTKDSSAGHFYYVDRENKKIMPTVGTTFTADHYAIVNYTWSAPAPIHMINQDSIDAYGLYEKQIELSDVSSVADAESRAASILAKRSVPFITGKLLVKSENANIPFRGETIDIVDTKTPTVNGLNLTGTYVVNKIKYKFPSAIEELEVGDKTWRLADWQTNTEERLKRLEEQFIRNQDILTELVSISNVPLGTVSPRYLKTITENYDVSELGLIIGHATYGILGTNKLRTHSNAFEGEVIHSIQQFENDYTEDFIDSDFEDTNGTATGWGSGSLNFTPGQIGLSSSIDYNNGTVSTVDVAVTIDSGTITIYVSADGGSNWEEATNNATHTFTVTGTDLRFKLLESGASTAEVSKVLLSNYH